MSDQDAHKSAPRYLSHGKGEIIYDKQQDPRNLHLLKP